MLNGKYYVYAHRRNDTGSIFYIGKGKDSRAWKTSGRESNKYWCNIVAKHGHTVELLKENLTEEESFIKEERFIKLLSDQICNLTKGGEGSSGYKHTAESKVKMSAGQTGRKLSDKHRANISKVSKGHSYHTADQIKKIKESNSTREVTQSTKDKIGSKNSREYMISNDKEVLVFPSQIKCAEFFKCNKATIYEYSKVNKPFRGYNIIKL